LPKFCFRRMKINFTTHLIKMDKRITFFGLVLFIFLQACKPACPIQSCHVRKVHLHGKKQYRGEPIWKKQSPKIGQGLPRKKAEDNQASQKRERKKKKK
jgi:hypothetical protein